MPKLLGLLEFAAEMAANDAALHEIEHLIVERACKIVQKCAKAAIGKGFADWPELAESTIADKERHGYKTPAPLLRTGELKDSIEYVVQDNEGAVGSNDPVAVYQELGTSRIPPRSFLMESARASEERVHRMAAGAAVAALTGHARHVGGLDELQHAAIEALHVIGHATREIWDDITEDSDDQ